MGQINAGLGSIFNIINRTNGFKERINFLIL